MPLIVNAQRSVDDVVSRIKNAVQLAVTAFPEDAALMQDLGKLEEYGIQMAHYAPEYDYKDVQANGYRALIEMGIRMMKYSVDVIVTSRNRQHYGDFKQMVHTYVNVIPYLQRMREESKGSKSVSIFGDTLADFFIDYIRSPEERGYATTIIGCYDFGHRITKWIMRYLFLISITDARNVKEFLSCLYCGDERKRVIDRAFSTPDVHKIRRFIGDDRFSIFKSTISPWLQTGRACRERREFLIKRQELLKIEIDFARSLVTVVRRNGTPATKTVRCRLLHEPVAGVTPTTLLINVHGGGYCVGCLYNNESYLRQWATQIPGKLAILSIDISLAPEHKFPSQIQEIVDVFLFLTTSSDEEVIEKIGFKPSNIILSGDSSGANFVMAATVTLSEMRKRWPTDVPLLPSAIFSFYGSFSIDMMMLPSYMICATTVFLSGINFAIFVEAYVPTGGGGDQNQNVIQQEEGEQEQSWISTAWNAIRWLFSVDSSPSPQTRLWTPRDPKQMKQEIREGTKLVSSPHISPLNYDDFESLSGIPLFLYAGDTDPILDHSIALAHKWKGRVELEVGNLMHGYLNAIGMDANARASSDRIVAKLKTLIETDMQ